MSDAREIEALKRYLDADGRNVAKFTRFVEDRIADAFWRVVRAKIDENALLKRENESLKARVLERDDLLTELSRKEEELRSLRATRDRLLTEVRTLTASRDDPPDEIVTERPLHAKRLKVTTRIEFL